MTGPEPTRRLLRKIGHGRARVGGSKEMPEEAAASHAAGHLQLNPRWAAPSGTGGVVAETHGAGRPLEQPTLGAMEVQMGADLGGIRVHDDEAAAASAEALGARAFSGGSHIVFGRGLYQPANPAGQSLLAHEIAHIVGGHTASDVLRRSPPGDDPTGGGGRRAGLTPAERAKLMQLRKSRPPGPGQKTILGILIDKDGNEYPVESGEEPHGLKGTHEGSIPRGPGEGFSGGGPSEKNIVTHIEGHAAAIMHQKGLTEATLLSPEPPCRVCDITQDWQEIKIKGVGTGEWEWKGNPKASRAAPAISVVLPPNSKLTVVSPGETAVYWSAPGAFVRGPGSGGAPSSTPTKAGTTAKAAAAKAAKGTTAKGTTAKAAPAPEATAAKAAPAPEATAAKAAPAEPEGRVAPGSGKSVAEINLSDYPPDGEGLILGRFTDGAAIRAITTGVTTVTTAISMGTQKDISLLGAVEWHFNKAIGAASEELESRFPDPKALWDKAGVDQLAKDYDAAVSKLNAPSTLLVAESLRIVLTVPDKLKEAAAQEALQRFANAGGGQGDWQNYVEAADAYMRAVIDLQQELDSAAWGTLPAIADDIYRRAGVLGRAGDDLEQTFWNLMQSPAAWFPLVYYELFGLLHTAGVLKNLGGKLGGLAAEIRGRASDYQRWMDKLEANLKKVDKTTRGLAARYHLKVPSSL